MTRLAISEPLLADLDRHAESAYPEECCGVLMGRRVASGALGVVQVSSVWPTANVHPGPRASRYAIAVEELLRIHKLARERGEEVVGYYHSHPDRAAFPSRTDAESACAGVSYLIVAVEAERVSERRCWRLRSDGPEFEEETLV